MVSSSLFTESRPHAGSDTCESWFNHLIHSSFGDTSFTKYSDKINSKISIVTIVKPCSLLWYVPVEIFIYFVLGIRIQCWLWIIVIKQWYIQNVMKSYNNHFNSFDFHVFIYSVRSRIGLCTYRFVSFSVDRMKIWWMFVSRCPHLSPLMCFTCLPASFPMWPLSLSNSFPS